MSTRATCSASSGPTDRARPPPSGCCSASWRRRAGRVELLGRPMPAAAHTVLERVGALVEGPGFYPTLSGRRNLALFDAAGRNGRRSTRRRRIADALERVGLGKRGPPPGAGLLARHAPAPRPGGGADPPAAAARAGRADQRARPAGHPRDPGPARRAGRGRHHGVPVEPPPRRGGADLHPRRHDGAGPAGGAGHRREPPGADRTAAHRHARRRRRDGRPRAAGRSGRARRRARARRCSTATGPRT